MELKTVCLTGWGMLPSCMPVVDLDGIQMEGIEAWPGYVKAAKSGDGEDLSRMWTTHALLEWLDRLLFVRVKQAPVRLVGWSMGGLIALCYADAFPERVKHLTLWSSTPCFMQREQWPGQTAERLKPLQEAVEQHNEEGFARFLKSQLPVSSAYREARRAWCAAKGAGSGERPCWEGLQASLQWLVQTDIRDRLPYIVVPTLLHHGTDDRIIPYAVAEELASRLPNARLHSHPGKGHVVWL